MTDLAEFLLARIAEDEARSAADDATAPKFAWVGPGGSQIPMEGVQQWYGRRLLAECEAKAAIVNYYQLCSPSEDIALTTVVRHLASVYAGHPEFDKRWLL